MKLIKRCPTCGYKNSCEEILCFACSTDVSSVGPTKEMDSKPESSASQQDEEKIQGVEPAPSQEPPPSPGQNPEEAPTGGNQDSLKTVRVSRAKLKLRIGSREFELDDGGVIGRHCVGKQFLEEQKTVSRKHAQFSRENGNWFVEDLGSTNGTYVNGTPIIPKQRVPIKKGDLVGLSSKITFEIIETF